MRHLSRARSHPEQGSAVIEFVLVAPLVVVLVVALLQFALVLHVRATLTSAAAEGARAASLAGADAEAGVLRTRMLLAETVAGGVVREIRVRPSTVGPVEVVVVRIDADLPLVGLLGPTAMSVEGRALVEGWT